MPDTPPIERRRAETGVKKPQRVCAEEFKADAAAVTNTVCTVTADGHGTGLYRKDVCICDHNAGFLRRLSLLCRGYSVFDLFSYPCSFSETGIEYRKDGAAAVLSVSPDQEAFTVDVSCSQDGCALCFEPILSNPDEYRRHAAYSAVFVTSSYENGVLTVTNRSGGRNYSVSVAAVSSDRFFLRQKRRKTVFYRAIRRDGRVRFSASFDKDRPRKRKILYRLRRFRRRVESSALRGCRKKRRFTAAVSALSAAGRNTAVLQRSQMLSASRAEDRADPP